MNSNSHVKTLKVNEMQNGQHVRQGDVLIMKVDKIPKGMKKLAALKDGSVKLALGEVTGHSHAFYDVEGKQGNTGVVEGYAPENYTPSLSQFFNVEKASATIAHEEHHAIEIPEGTYMAAIQTEYTPQAIQRVAD